MQVDPVILSQNLAAFHFAGNFHGAWNVYLASG
jgi:hypothetical protein